MAEGWEVGRPRIAQAFVSTDGTERYLVEGQARDAETVETVWMPEGDGGEAGDGSDSARHGSGEVEGRCEELGPGARSAFRARWVAR